MMLKNLYGETFRVPEVKVAIQASHYAGLVCPYCHARSAKGHESNGFSGDAASYLCGTCNEQWDACNYTDLLDDLD